MISVGTKLTCHILQQNKSTVFVSRFLSYLHGVHFAIYLSKVTWRVLIECLSDKCITSSSSGYTTTFSTNSLSRSVISYFSSVCLIYISALTDEEMVVNSIVFMVAGYETTATTISWLFYDLAIHTDIQDKLVQEIDSDLGKVYHTLVL